MADVMATSEDHPRVSAGYKSFKKKYRKMRIAFEHKMLESEDILKQEAKARDTVKRLAIENEYAYPPPRMLRAERMMMMMMMTD